MTFTWLIIVSSIVILIAVFGTTDSRQYCRKYWARLRRGRKLG